MRNNGVMNLILHKIYYLNVYVYTTYISLFRFPRRKPHKFGPTQNCHFCQKGAKDVIILCHNCCRSNFPKNATALCT